MLWQRNSCCSREGKRCVRVEKQVAIQRPIEEVFAFLTDMHNVSRWTPVKSIRPVAGNGEQVAVGETYIQVIEFMGQQFEITTEITTYQPSKAFGFKAVSGPVPLTSTFTLTPVENGTQITLVGEGELGNALKFAGPLASSLVKKQLDSQLALLKQVLES